MLDEKLQLWLVKKKKKKTPLLLLFILPQEHATSCFVSGMFLINQPRQIPVESLC